MCIGNNQEAVFQSNSTADNTVALVILITKGFDTRGWELTK